MPEHHGLTRNPFVERHDHPLVGAGSRRLICDMVDTVDRSVRDNTQIIAILLGAYGEGKTFTLRKFNEVALDPKRFESNCSRAVARSNVSAIITASEARLPSAYMPYFYSSFARELGPQFFLSLADRLKASGFSASPLPAVVDFSFAAALGRLVDGQDADLAVHWLMGGRLQKKDLGRIGVMENIVTEDYARRCFISLLVVCKKAGFDCVCVLVDEVEYLFHPGAKKAIQCLTSIKYLYDSVAHALSDYGEQVAPMVLVLCMVPSTWQQVRGLVEKEAQEGGAGLQALLRRIKDEGHFRLQRFIPEETKQLMSLLLETARNEGNQLGELYPFDEATLRLIHNRANGMPGFIIDESRRILEEADRRCEEINQVNAAVWLGQRDGQALTDVMSGVVEEIDEENV